MNAGKKLTAYFLQGPVRVLGPARDTPPHTVCCINMGPTPPKDLAAEEFAHVYSENGV